MDTEGKINGWRDKRDKKDRGGEIKRWRWRDGGEDGEDRGGNGEKERWRLG